MKHFIISLLFLVVSASAYTPYEKGQNGVGALDEKVVPNKTVAVSRDLKYLLGKVIYIQGIGERKVNDLMAKRWKHKIDLCVPSINQAKEFGVKKLIISY